MDGATRFVFPDGPTATVVVCSSGIAWRPRGLKRRRDVSWEQVGRARLLTKPDLWSLAGKPPGQPPIELLRIDTPDSHFIVRSSHRALAGDSNAGSARALAELVARHCKVESWEAEAPAGWRRRFFATQLLLGLVGITLFVAAMLVVILVGSAWPLAGFFAFAIVFRYTMEAEQRGAPEWSSWQGHAS